MLKQTNNSRLNLKKTGEKVERFLGEPNTIVFFFDEGRFGIRSTLTRVWAKKGEPLNVKIKQGYQSFYMYSAVSPHTGDDFSLILPQINTEMMDIYLSELSKAYDNHRILLIMDQAGWHKSKELDIPQNIEIEFLPPYSPELNPVERLWKWIKKEAVHNKIFDTLEQLMESLMNVYPKLSPKKFVSLCACSYL